MAVFRQGKALVKNLYKIIIIVVSVILVVEFFSKNRRPIESSNQTSSPSPDLNKREEQDEEGKPHNFQRPNQLINQYDKYVANKIELFAKRKSLPDDAELVKLARQMMDPPKSSREMIGKWPAPTKQTTAIDNYLREKRGGRFIECGAYDGETGSPTLYLETARGWTGLLIEADPDYYTQLIGKKRNVYSINACLSPNPYFSVMNFKHEQGETGKLVEPDKSTDTVPCFPLQTLLLALNWTTVDFFALDVEGFELAVLKTMPWDRYHIATLAVEYMHGPGGEAAYTEYMNSLGYKVLQKIIFNDPPNGIVIEDLVFVKNSNKTTKL